MRLGVIDVVSPSYFVATTAVELGFFAAEGVDTEFVYQPKNPGAEMRAGALDFYGLSAYLGLCEFKDWEGAKLLCALSQHAYWFLGVRADLGIRPGDINALKGLRISASRQPAMLLKQLIKDAGLDEERDNIRIVSPPAPRTGDHNRAGIGVQAIEEGVADGFWGNGMRCEFAVRRGVATLLLDIRRGDGPPSARGYTFPALMATDKFIAAHPDAAAGAVRAIVRTQRALRANPLLATKVGEKLFPPEEASIIGDLVARDAPFYEASISEEAIANVNAFARKINLLSKPAPYAQVVATQFRDLWTV
ncbi:MAG: ABC transporter substrate-binding protein [Betaproteobacteria bacterium]|nr:ABC transporter substrate-binding protein [Betaproteobacteria bacterium]